MLTDADIAFMYESRAQITEKRKQPVTLIYEVGSKDPFTGEIVGVERITREVLAVVTEYTGMTSQDIVLEGSAIYEIGDVQLSVDIELISDIIEDITTVKYDGDDYLIVSYGKKGIGKRNRYELLTRRVS